MPADANPLDDPDDAAALAAYGAALLAAVEIALPSWTERAVASRWLAARGTEPPPTLVRAAVEAGDRARSELVPELRALLETDVDAQGSNPLAILRRAVAHASSVLSEASVPPVARDADAVRLFPDDVYDLTPASFADIDPSLHDPGVSWGAAKAHVVLARRRRQGRR